MDITKLQQNGYENEDKFIVKNDGTIIPCTFIYKCYYTAEAFSESLEMSFGVGYGLGLGTTVDGLEVEALMKSDLLILSYSGCNGWDLGHDLHATVEVAGITMFEEIEYESLVNPTKKYTSADGNMPNAYEWLGVDRYAIIGFTWSNKFYADTFSLRYKEIWR